jgi:hypothetical protein
MRRGCHVDDLNDDKSDRTDQADPIAQPLYGDLFALIECTGLHRRFHRGMNGLE